ncbi:hypothetical protein [Streptomyces sp. NPDC002769]|uniref:hypothetical protein n=1 Tax=Streptomyces sp. NPDC002769 TaxID=3154542 RepID=UPI003319ED64
MTSPPRDARDDARTRNPAGTGVVAVLGVRPAIRPSADPGRNAWHQGRRHPAAKAPRPGVTCSRR